MSETQRHGGCHCGAVRYTVDIDLTAPAIACNCSMCGRAGTLLVFVPHEKFKLDSGEDAVIDYQFNKKVIHHFFCKTCGIKPFARGKNPKLGETVAVNVRTIDDIDVHELPTKTFDGRKML